MDCVTQLNENSMDVDLDMCKIRTRQYTSVILNPFEIALIHVLKSIGAVSFVKTLLMMAGIEPNPGPTDKFIFRYQYLLIQIGTGVFRKLFDHLVNYDFIQYLHANPKEYTQLLFLMSKDIITDEQKKFLPPVDTKPDSANFDVTLLACLLRNVCGLRGQKDPVWTNPPPTDLSIEADIARLRECRNNLLHSATVFISETDLTTKWNELATILNRLNKICKMADLSTQIADAESMIIDVELQKRNNEMINMWWEMDRSVDHGIGELTKKFEQLETWQAKLITEVTEIKKSLDEKRQTGACGCDHIGNTTDLKHRLLDTYNRDCSTLPLSALCTEEEEGFFQVYQTPTMHQVDYHRAEKRTADENNSISSYRDIFGKEEQCFQNIYVTGDAGVGKTSLCKCLCLLWCKSQTGGTMDDPDIQSDINFLARFEFVFYISLRDTECRDVVSMIVDQYFDSDSKELNTTIEQVLKQHKCLLLLDAFDEWSPNVRGKRECRIPLRVHSDNCVYLTTCRPYKIENVRLARREIDQHVLVSGIHGESSVRFIAEVVKHMNKENGVDKNAEDFMREVEGCGIEEQLCIPMIASHLVVVWFTQKLTKMPKALLYGKVLELLFTRAKQRNVLSPSSPTSKVQLPGVLSKLRYLNEHVSLLQKLCLLSFRSLFQQDKDVFSLVFTRHQLMAEPYLLCDEQMDFLCKIGILSIHKVIGCFEERQQKLSFLHKSYIEYFAALFVCSFDIENVMNNIARKWASVNYVVQFQNFFILLAGFSYQKVKSLIDNMYLTTSADLALFRRNAIVHIFSISCIDKLKLLQTIVINCWKEGGRCNDPNTVLQLQDFIFYDDSNVESLKQLLVSNVSFVKSLHSVGRYLDNFSRLPNILCLHLVNIEPGDYAHFNECMLQNLATLRTICIKGDFDIKPLVLVFPVKIHQHLTALYLSKVKMQHKSLHDLVFFLSDNVRIENIELEYVYCDTHQEDDSDCTLTLNLQNHTKLISLCLRNVNVLCHGVNISCLKSITMCSSYEMIVCCYIDILKSIKDSQIECFSINGQNKLDNITMHTLLSTIKSLPSIAFLELYFMNLPDGVILQLHPDATDVLELNLFNVSMGRQYFHAFVESVGKSVKEVGLFECTISSVDGDCCSEMSVEESLDYMSEYITSNPATNITYRGRYQNEYIDGNVVAFETTKYQ